MKILYIRAETLKNEYRTPLTPSDVSILLKTGFTVYVQTSTQRIFPDYLYDQVGAIVTDKPWFSTDFDCSKNDMMVIGLKELTDLDKLSKHTHLYFSHSFKGQSNANLIIDSFKKSQSLLYDLEYITNQHGKREISFSYFAGISGCLLGILCYYDQLSVPLKPFPTFNHALFQFLNLLDKNIPTIKIIGNGQCAKGVCSMLETLKLPYTMLSRKDTSNRIDIHSADLFFNCIKLDKESNNVFFDEKSEDESLTKKNKTIIVDISCDIGKYNNPIPICKQETTWEEPIYKCKNIDIISISNLPSLLPKESSEYFSERLLCLLLDKDHIGWKNCLNAYLNL